MFGVMVFHVNSNTGTGSHRRRLLFIVYIVKNIFYTQQLNLCEFSNKNLFLVYLCFHDCLLAGNYQWRLGLLNFDFSFVLPP